jgi:hypothetical protein
VIRKCCMRIIEQYSRDKTAGTACSVGKKRDGEGWRGWYVIVFSYVVGYPDALSRSDSSLSVIVMCAEMERFLIIAELLSNMSVSTPSFSAL